MDLRSVVTWQLASIFVALPVYPFVMRLTLRESGANPERIESGVRKWLTYIALLLTATGLVCDLVCFVEYLLRGELSLRFTLKCLVVLVICGSIFWYYFGFLRGRMRSGWFAAFAVALASIGICFGMGFAGTPSRKRAIEADGRRVQDLRMIANAVHQMPAPPKSLGETHRSAVRVSHRGSRNRRAL